MTSHNIGVLNALSREQLKIVFICVLYVGIRDGVIVLLRDGVIVLLGDGVIVLLRDEVIVLLRDGVIGFF